MNGSRQAAAVRQSRELQTENEEKHAMPTTLVFLIFALLAAGLFAYLLLGISLYLRDVYKANTISLKEHLPL